MNSTMKILSGLFLISIISLSTSCDRDKSCKATVECKDANGQAVKGAEVYLYANIKPNVDGDIKAHGVTDDNGKVSFIFKLPAIFNVNATVNSKKANGMIKLEEGKEITETVTVQ